MLPFKLAHISDTYFSSAAFLANLSFLLLFLAMTLYWIHLAFFKTANSLVTQQVITEPQSVLTGPNKKLSLANFGTLAIYGSNIALFLLLCVRWQESGHFPLSNLYESLMFLSWSCTSIHIFLTKLSPTMLFRSNQKALSVYGAETSTNPTVKYDYYLMSNLLLGSVLAPSALFLNAFATFSLPKEMQQSGPLVPALQSNWLMMHVTVMIISYSALMLGSLLAIAYLILLKVSSNKTSANQKLQTNFVFYNPNVMTTNLDYLSYRIIGIGFPFLTIGILSGAVWANEAWGSYWSWDPKETWALLTWFVFAIYLHTRLQKGWEGEKPAMLASLGFVVVWICYLGVNLLGEGLHSYGFLT